MDDEEDPQGGANAAGTGGGASVDLNAAAKAEGETDEVTLGIDVSKYQGSIDWEQVAQSGVEFAMIRVGYRTKVTGIIMRIREPVIICRRLRRTGFLWGLFFLSAVTEEEARRKLPGWRILSPGIPLPIRWPITVRISSRRTAGSTGWESEERTDIACAFLDTIAAAGYTPMFYASRNEMEGKRAVEHGYAGEQIPGMGVSVSGAALSGDACFHLQRNPCDVAVYQPGNGGGHPGQRGRKSGLLRLQQAAEAKDQTPAEEVAANPELGINFTEVNDTVTAKELTNLRTLPTTLDSEVVYQLRTERRFSGRASEATAGTG